MQSKEDLDMSWSVDIPALIKEISGNPEMRMMGSALMIFKAHLAKIALRAAELNDPELNILMLKGKLYECPHEEIQEKISIQYERIKKTNKNGK